MSAEHIASKIWEGRNRLAASVLVATAVGVLLALVIPGRYSSTSRIIPPQQVQSSLGSIVGQMGAVGFSGLASLRNPADVYVQLLRSDTVTVQLIKRFALDKHYDLKTLDDVKRKLENRSYIRGTREGVVVIRVTDVDADLASAIANGYVDELYKLVQKLGYEEAAHRRQFIEGRLLEISKSLEAKEGDLKAMQERMGMVRVDGQVASTYYTMEALRTTILAKEIALRTLLTSSTPQNPAYKQSEAEIAAYKAELRKLEENPTIRNPKFVVSADRAPELLLEYVRKQRGLRAEEAMYTAIQKQYELIQMEETQGYQQFLVVDTARPATRRNFPTRPMIVLITALAGLGIAIYLIATDRFRLPAQFARKGEAIPPS